MSGIKIQPEFWESKQLDITISNFIFTLKVLRPLGEEEFSMPSLDIESVYSYVNTKEEIDNDKYIIETLLVYVSKEVMIKERKKAKKILKKDLHQDIFTVIKNNKKYIRKLIKLGIKQGFFEEYFKNKNYEGIN